jgi:predicted hotdog family 3-hydroxylacyl-ACP dehydratase
MLIDKSVIANMIPHAGPMCLLEGVLEWDAKSIRCASRNHRDPNHPLRAGDRLPALAAIEYAAQAMAVHGGLSASAQSKPRAGYLASVRDVICRRERLDDLDGYLVIDATRILGDESRVVYEFSVRVGEVDVLSGRATAILRIDEPDR